MATVSGSSRCGSRPAYAVVSADEARRCSENAGRRRGIPQGTHSAGRPSTAHLCAEGRAAVPQRGDYDAAVFQAFKEVEVGVRNAANAKGAGYPDSDVGTRV